MAALFLDILVLFVMIAILIIALRRAIRFHVLFSVDAIISIMLLSYGLPIFCNLFLPLPTRGPTAWIENDDSMRIQMDLVLLVAIFFLKFGAWKSSRMSLRLSTGNDRASHMMPTGFVPVMTSLSWVVMLLPVLALPLIAPRASAFLTYGSPRVRGFADDPRSMFAMSILQVLNWMSMLGFYVVYWVQMRRWRTFWNPTGLLAVLLALSTIWIDGKRAIAVAFLLIIGTTNFLEGRARRSLVLIPILALAASILYSQWGAHGPWAERLSTYEIMRGDMARDHTLRCALHRCEWFGNKILPFPGESYFFVAVQYIPRIFWEEKPWPAPVYFTWYAHARAGKAEPMGWIMQFGFIEELLMNFGYAGLLGCVVFGWITRLLDKRTYLSSTHYTFLWALLMLSVVIAINTVLTFALYMALPLWLLGRPLRNPNNWIPLDEEWTGADELIRYEA